MGYSTDFFGGFNLDKPITNEHFEILQNLYDKGVEDGPSSYCQWIVSREIASGWPDRLEWDGGEKFYKYVEWLHYIIDRYLKPWGYTLNGTVEWQGEDRDDAGQIEIVNNVISTYDIIRVRA